jgi:Cdc6-like AAA superfamily ATPase
VEDHYIFVSIAFVLFVVAIISKYFLSTKKGSAYQPPSKQPSLLGDAPIAEASKDILGRRYFVEKLKSIISDYLLNEESIRICIDAKWGDGKTSIFNLLKEKLKKERCDEKEKIKCIDFNPWYYNNKESALKDLIELLGSTVSKQHPYPSTNSDIDKLIKVLVGGLCSKFLGVPFKVLQKDKDIKTLLKSISESIEKTGKKYVIFIDDLDRLDMPAIKNILKVIMIISEIRSLIVLIAVSSEHICANKKIISKEYIEKIMTIILPIPKINHRQLEEYFDDEFRKIIRDEEYSQKENEEIERMKKGFSSLNKLCNLRNVKRVLDAFKSLYKGFGGEIDSVDFILIVYLNIFFPGIVEAIYNDRSRYIDVDLSTNPESEKDRKKIVNALAKDISKKLSGDKEDDSKVYVEELIRSYSQQDEDENDLKDILSMMFPKCDEWWGGKHYCKQSKGIADAKYFYKYFSFFVDEGDISDKEIDEYISKWKESKDRVHDIGKVLAQYCNNSEIFFRKLEDKKEMAGPELLKDIAKEYSTFDSNDKNDFFIIFLIDNFGDDKVFLEDIVQNMKNLICCWHVASNCDSKVKGDNYRNIFFKRLNEFAPEQILKFGDYKPDLTHNINVMIYEYIEWTEKLKDEEKINEIFRKKYVPIIVADKRLILNYMKESWNIPLPKFFGEDNIKEAISFLEKQNLTEKEKLILDNFKKNEKEPY